MENFKLTPEWVLNELPQLYGIIDEEIAIVTEIEQDFVLIRQALQTLRIQYNGYQETSVGTIFYCVLIQVEDLSQVLSQKLRELKHINPIIRRNFLRLPEKRAVLSSLFLLSVGLMKKVNKINNESHQIDEILSSLSELLLALKCQFFLDSDRNIAYSFEHQDEKYVESDEGALLIMLGAFACFQINLGYLEFRNPKLKGLNKTLSAAFPEIYDAYINLSKNFGFKGTARLLTPQLLNKKRISKYLLNAEVDNWDSDLLELDENYIEKEVIEQSLNNVNERNGFLSHPQKLKSCDNKSESISFSAN